MTGQNYIQKDTFSRMFIAALFTIANKWKHPKCMLTGGWIKKMQYIQTVEYYSARKKIKIMPFALKAKRPKGKKDGPGD